MEEKGFFGADIKDPEDKQEQKGASDMKKGRKHLMMWGLAIVLALALLLCLATCSKNESAGRTNAPASSAGSSRIR